MAEILDNTLLYLEYKLRNSSALLRSKCFRSSQRFYKRSSAMTCPPPTLDLVSSSQPLGFISECEYLVDQGKDPRLRHSLFIQLIQPMLNSDSLLGKYY